jgi:ketosteroid isomerase-like protein
MPIGHESDLGMTDRNELEVVQDVFAAFAARDVEGVLALADPNVELVAVTAGYADRDEPYRGHEGIRCYFRDVAQVWEELRLSPTEFRQVGELVLVTGRVSARSHSRVVSGSSGWLWRIENGLVVSLRVYPSASEALAALSEAS